MKLIKLKKNQKIILKKNVRILFLLIIDSEKIVISVIAQIFMKKIQVKEKKVI